MEIECPVRVSVAFTMPGPHSHFPPPMPATFVAPSDADETRQSLGTAPLLEVLIQMVSISKPLYHIKLPILGEAGDHDRFVMPWLSYQGGSCN